MDFSTSANTDSPQPRMNSTAQQVNMETFPAINHKTLKDMSVEDFQTAVDTYMDMAMKVMNLYPDECEKVNELLKEAKKNREEMESRQEDPSVKKKGYILISDEDHAMIVKKLKTKKEVKHRFDGDQYTTKFRMVDGEMTAFDTDHPEGRGVMSHADYKKDLAEKPHEHFKMMSPKMVLRSCYGCTEITDICVTDALYFKIMRSLPDNHVCNLLTELKLHLAGVTCLVAKKYGIEFTGAGKDCFALMCKKDMNKEHLREMIVLLSAVMC